MHQALLVAFILWAISDVSSTQIPWINNVSLIPLTPTAFTTILNSTCDQCICKGHNSRSAAVNCFLSNNTCQLFGHVPRNYQLQTNSQAQLYFPSGSVPNASQCCIPDLNVLLDKLKNATMITVSQTKPRCLGLDNHGHLVTVHHGGSTINRYSSLNLTLVDQIPLTQSGAASITFHGDAYYIGTDSSNIEVVDSNTLLTVNVITHPNISGVRDIIFLGDGQIMVVSSTNNQRILFFNRSNTSSVNYTFAYELSTSYSGPHGLWYVNDSFFYATSWNANSVYSYATVDGVTWNETLFANVNTIVASGGVTHVSVDGYERRWMSRGGNTMLIYDSSRVYVGNFTLPSNGVFDALFIDNCSMYLSDYVGGQIIRLDPHVTC